MTDHALSIPERWLWWTFSENRWLPENLRGTAGECIRILSPGLHNDGDGPDFRDALLDIDGVRQRGDVEIHRHPHCWFQHGHHEDERYRRVILHLLWEAPAGIPPSLTERFAHACIAPQLTVPLAVWMAAMHSRDDRPTELIIARALPLETLAALAEKRFQRKMTRMHEWFGRFDPEDALFLALGEALGYSANKNAFRQLLWRYPASRLLAISAGPAASPGRLWLALLHLAGLGEVVQRSHTLRQNPRQQETVDILFRSLRDAGHFPALAPPDWRFSRVRPHNTPFVRLAALAALLLRFRQSPLFRTLLDAARERPQPARLLANWQSELSPEFPPALAGELLRTLNISAPRHVLGRQRARQFLINGALPALCCWAEHSRNHGFREYLGGIYENFPGVETARVIRRYIGDHPRQQMLQRSGFYQQGIIEWAVSHT